MLGRDERDATEEEIASHGWRLVAGHGCRDGDLLGPGVGRLGLAGARADGPAWFPAEARSAGVARPSPRRRHDLARGLPRATRDPPRLGSSRRLLIGRPGDIGDGDVGVAGSEETAGETRRAPSCVEDRGVPRQARLLDQLQRHLRHRLVPTQLPRLPFAVYRLPMGLVVAHEEIMTAPPDRSTIVIATRRRIPTWPSLAPILAERFGFHQARTATCVRAAGATYAEYVAMRPSR